jgi:branched-chain amino acid transport system ATP-binding protein
MAKAVKAKSAELKKPRALPKARKAGADELSLIKGIGPKIQGQLNEFGIFHFDQIADWKKPECNWVNEHLKFKGRIEREEWIKQAKALSKPPKKTVSKISQGKKTAVAKTNKLDVTEPIKANTGKSKVTKPAAVKKATLEKSQKNVSGYGSGGVETVISVEAVTREVAKMSDGVPDADALAKLANDKPFLSIKKLKAGYGQMEILHDFNLFADKGQSLCLIGPNGAGKSTVLHSIFGFTNIFSGNISAGGKDITHQKPNDKLKTAGIAYILQDNSVFPNMTVEENLWMGGFLKDRPDEAKEAAERVFQKYDRLAKRRGQPARVLSGGERRLLEISRALVMNPEILLVDEPSIGLEPRFIDMVFEILDDLQNAEGKTIIMVEQNAKKGLEFADIGYVLVSGELAKAGPGKELLDDPDVGRLFLGG